MSSHETFRNSPVTRVQQRFALVATACLILFCALSAQANSLVSIVGSPFPGSGMGANVLIYLPLARQIITTNKESGTLSRWDVNQDGTVNALDLAMITPNTSPTGVVASPDERFLYVKTAISINALAWNGTSYAQFGAVSLTPGISGQNALAYVPGATGNLLFLNADRSGPNTLLFHQVGPDGNLGPGMQMPTGGVGSGGGVPASAHTIASLQRPDGTLIFVMNKGSNSISVFLLTATALIPVGQFGPPSAVVLSGAIAVGPGPNGSLLHAGTTDGKLAVFAINANGSLTFEFTVAPAVGIGGLTLAVEAAPDGTVAATVAPTAESGPRILVYDPGTGRIEAVDPDTAAGVIPLGLGFSPNGQMLFTANGPGLSSISAYVNEAALPVVEIDPISQAEGDAGITEFRFRVHLDRKSDLVARVDFKTSPGSATEGVDYTKTLGTLEFAPGETEKTLTVPVVGEVIHESDEQFAVRLDNPKNARFAGELSFRLGPGTIQNDDAAPVIRIDGISKSEGNSGNTPFEFRVSLDRPSSLPVRADYQTANGTAEEGTDYSAGGGTLEIPAGSITESITVQVIGDTTVEPDETFVVTLSNPVNGTLDPNATSGQGEIRNDDAGGLVQSIQQLQAKLQALVDAGKIKQQGTGLLTLLRNAFRAALSGNVNQVYTELQAFINIVKALTSAGHIRQDDGNSLIGDAENIQNQLE